MNSTSYVFTLLSVFLFLSLEASGQKNAQKKQSAFTQLKNLHEGYLFFQLFDREDTKKSIYVHLGDKGVAEYQKELDKKHSNLIAAIKKEYRFSKVVFFHSNDKKALKTGDFSKVKFYNVNNELVNNDTIDFSQYFIAEVSRIELDSAEAFTGDGDTIKVPEYSFSALVVRDKNFKQLKKPFPYYIRTMKGVPIFQKKPYKLIRAFQNKLERVYQRWLRKKQ